MKKMNRVLSLLIVVTLSLSQAWAERISKDDAALVANNFMNVASQNSALKKTPAKKMVMKAVPAQEENQYYVYENENGEGWVIIAANDVVKPVLAYSETGHFRTDNMPVNIRKWMGKYNTYISKLEKDGVTAGEETQAQWKKLRKGANSTKATAIVGPLIKTKWDQAEPFWDQCPGSGNSKAYTGCVATAMAQVMKYWEWPETGTGSHSYQPLDPNTGRASKRYGTQTVNFGETTYDWANMINDYTGNYTTAQGAAVATLMYHCGVATEMMYGNADDNGSGTYTVNYEDWDWGTTYANEGGCAQNALWYYFGYKKPTGYMRNGYTEQGHQYYEKWSDANWTAMIKEELDKNHPIMYGGASDEGGHSFICDGYDSNEMFHFNWGWSGENDGYFTLSKLNPGGGGAGGGSYDFSEDQDVIIGIVPDKKDLPQVTVTWSVNGETTTTEFTQEDPLVLPEYTADCSETNVFVGWTKSSTVSGEKPADLFNTAAGKSVMEAVTYYAVFAEIEGEGSEEINDRLTNDEIGVRGSNYKEWANISLISDAVYAGMTAGSDNTIQMRTKNKEEGLVSTTSGGKLTKITVEWNSKTTDGRKLDIYGSNQAYSAASDLYTSNKGELIGSLKYVSGSSSSETIEVQGNYAYVGARSNNSALFLDAITFTWGGGVTYKNYSLGCQTQDVESVKSEKTSNKKMLIDGQLFIMHNGAMYNVQGTRVK